jgi:hypothetical protein
VSLCLCGAIAFKRFSIADLRFQIARVGFEQDQFEIKSYSDRVVGAEIRRHSCFLIFDSFAPQPGASIAAW